MESLETAVAAVCGIVAGGESAPLLVAVDGRSGVGKSTLARAVAAQCGAAVIPGDDFYSGGTSEEWDAMSAIEKADHCINWRRQRPLLQALRAGRGASWFPYDWDTMSGRLRAEPEHCPAVDLVLLEGVYSGRPELADLVDLRILATTPEPTRQSRLRTREGSRHGTRWDARWAEAEVHYFGHVMPAQRFDLVVTT